MTALQIANPNPLPDEPSARQLQNGWKIFFKFSGLIPAPVSATSITIRPSGPAASRTLTRPSGAVAWKALCMRLMKIIPTSPSCATIRAPSGTSTSTCTRRVWAS